MHASLKPACINQPKRITDLLSAVLAGSLVKPFTNLICPKLFNKVTVIVKSFQSGLLFSP